MTSNHYIYVHPFLQPSLLFTLAVSHVSHAKSILALKAAFSLIHVQTLNPVPKVSIILLRSHRKTRMWDRNRYVSNRTRILQTSFFFANLRKPLAFIKVKVMLQCLIDHNLIKNYKVVTLVPSFLSSPLDVGEGSVPVPRRLSPRGNISPNPLNTRLCMTQRHPGRCEESRESKPNPMSFSS